MHEFQYLLGEPAKSSLAQSIVLPHAHDDVYEYEHVSLSKYSQVVHTLLETCAPDDIIAEADSALRDLKIVPHHTPTKLASTLISMSLLFGGVYRKLHLQPLFIEFLPDKLHDMVRKKMADKTRVAYDKLARHAYQLQKMTQSTSGKGKSR